MTKYCKSCKKETNWVKKKAHKNTLVSFPDFPGEKYNEFKVGQTISASGPAVLTDCISCSECGRSIELEKG